MEHSDTPRTDEHAGWRDATGCVIGWRDKVPTEFARHLERENAELRENLKTWEWSGRWVMLALAAISLLVVIRLFTGCTINPETPAERKARKVLEPGESLIFRDGRWEEVR